MIGAILLGALVTQRLIIMRHGKSAESAMLDHERVLNDIGHMEVVHVAEQLIASTIQPDLVLCSDANRTRETWLITEPYLNKTVVEFTNKLYMASLDDILDLISETPQIANTLMLVGHNPTSSQLINWLTGQQVDMGTANAVWLESDLLWGKIFNQKGLWQLKKHFVPILND